MNDARIKLLFVCARNRIRSVAAEALFDGSPQFQARSRGVAANARIRLTASDIAWADHIFVMEKNHKNRMTQQFPEALDGKPVHCLFVEDIYQPMEEALLDELRAKLTPFLEMSQSDNGSETGD